MSEDPIKLTPMLEQYKSIKAEHPDALLFYRMGDFYEMFFEDAVTAARELQITLTTRNKNTRHAAPMCGVPWQSAQSYIADLINKGYRVAICDQTEDPKAAKGLVKRAVTRVITPGTVFDDAILEAKSHNYLSALYDNAANSRSGFVWTDVSTGQWTGVEFNRQSDLWQWVQKIAPSELLLPQGYTVSRHCRLDGVRVLHMPQGHFDLKRAAERVLQIQGVRDASVLDLDGKDELMRACGALLFYLEQTQMCSMDHLKPFTLLNLSRRLLIDEVTESNLEIFIRLNGRKGKGTLRHVVDDTITPMGGRLLEDMLRHPWRDITPAVRIQDAVLFLHTYDNCRAALRQALKNIYDLERLSTRISIDRATPRDFTALRGSLAALPEVCNALLQHPCVPDQNDTRQQTETLPEALRHIVDNWDNMEDCTLLLEAALLENLPQVITEGCLFKKGYHADLDTILDLIEHGEDKLQEILEAEQKTTGINKLKIGYNRIFGYYYELSRSARALSLPDRFIRRQTLANVERFTTESLKKLEEELLSAAERRKSLEYKLFQDLRLHIAKQRERIVHLADIIAQLDYFQSLAHVGRQNNWCRPALTDDANLDIREGRHPVVESILGSENFVPNNFSLDTKRRLCLLTGPNMAGKSTILRQVALICLLAQMGSMVPASEARIGMVDRLFSRVGAADNLTQNQSTFMVEMMETARILRQATRRSLIILDEIGRGTSTYDGVALAWAVVEDLAKRQNASLRTLFATHYHELTALEGRLPGVFTMNIAIREYKNDILFLHKLVPGPSDRSYGVEVARLAGVPAPVVQRAKAILTVLERGKTLQHNAAAAISMSLPGLAAHETRHASIQTALPEISPAPPAAEHPLVGLLQDISPETISPMEALALIVEWKKLWGTEPAMSQKTSAALEN
ncbi:MAG: DNA mismatch repair protein MutS [Desulfovibrio sp.]|jgi:DNA mismatch repair protein MutS|nr:DNA mismatch repair protein MutS [Desulfovibrio sp.]